MDEGAQQEQRLNRMNAGRMVSVAWQAFEPVLSALEKRSYETLLMGFRAGKKPDELYQSIASCVAIADIRNEVRLTTVRGEQAAKETLDA